MNEKPKINEAAEVDWEETVIPEIDAVKDAEDSMFYNPESICIARNQEDSARKEWAERWPGYRRAAQVRADERRAGIIAETKDKWI